MGMIAGERRQVDDACGRPHTAVVETKCGVPAPAKAPCEFPKDGAVHAPGQPGMGRREDDGNPGTDAGTGLKKRLERPLGPLEKGHPLEHFPAPNHQEPSIEDTAASRASDLSSIS